MDDHFLQSLWYIFKNEKDHLSFFICFNTGSSKPLLHFSCSHSSWWHWDRKWWFDNAPWRKRMHQEFRYPKYRWGFKTILVLCSLDLFCRDFYIFQHWIIYISYFSAFMLSLFLCNIWIYEINHIYDT